MKNELLVPFGVEGIFDDLGLLLILTANIECHVRVCGANQIHLGQVLGPNEAKA